MDPNAVLTRMRELFRLYEDRRITPEQYREMCELFGTLDAWIVRGGFLPHGWASSRWEALHSENGVPLDLVFDP